MYFWLFFTAWWLSIIIQEKHRHQWLIPTVIWGMIMVRLITWHVKSYIGFYIKLKSYGILLLIVFTVFLIKDIKD